MWQLHYFAHQGFWTKILTCHEILEQVIEHEPFYTLHSVLQCHNRCYTMDACHKAGKGWLNGSAFWRSAIRRSIKHFNYRQMFLYGKMLSDLEVSRFVCFEIKWILNIILKVILRWFLNIILGFILIHWQNCVTACFKTRHDMDVLQILKLISWHSELSDIYWNISITRSLRRFFIFLDHLVEFQFDWQPCVTVSRHDHICCEQSDDLLV